MQEIFVPIKGYEGVYEISNFGRMRSFSLKKRGKILKTQIDRLGYEKTRVSKDNIRKTLSIHRIVALHFIPIDENRPFVNHKDGVKTNNHVDNLEWCTHSENIKHSFRAGVIRKYAWREKKMPQSVRDKISAAFSGGKHLMAVPVLDTQTGIYYGCVKEAAEARNINSWLVRKDSASGGKKYGIIRV